MSGIRQSRDGWLAEDDEVPHREPPFSAESEDSLAIKASITSCISFVIRL
jgi:hypothetical protein